MIDELLVEIAHSLEHRLYRVALISTLSLPFICGNFAYGRGNEQRNYIRWYGEYVKHNGPLAHLFTPAFAYQFRGEVLHYYRNFNIIPGQNSPAPPRIPLQFTEGTELLVEPTGEHAEMLRRIVNPHMERRGVAGQPDVFMVCPATYCAEVVTGAQIWLDGLTHDERSRLSNMFTIYQASGRPDPMPHPSVVAQAYGRPKG
jgi:hypothetical protein